MTWRIWSPVGRCSSSNASFEISFQDLPWRARWQRRQTASRKRGSSPCGADRPRTWSISSAGAPSSTAAGLTGSSTRSTSRTQPSATLTRKPGACGSCTKSVGLHTPRPTTSRTRRSRLTVPLSRAKTSWVQMIGGDPESPRPSGKSTCRPSIASSGPRFRRARPAWPRSPPCPQM
jgi:hypothetical protein